VPLTSTVSPRPTKSPAVAKSSVAHSGAPGINSDYLRMPLLDKCLTMVYLDPIVTCKSDLLPGAEYFVPTYAYHLQAVLDHLGRPKPLILGHSHDGRVVLELAIQNSHRLGGVIAYDTAPVYNDDLREEATRQMTAFATRWADDRPEATIAAQAWHAVGGGEPRTEEKFLTDILPAYFAVYRRSHDPNHPPALNVTVVIRVTARISFARPPKDRHRVADHGRLEASLSVVHRPRPLSMRGSSA
jgi:pimeloyl-ACP methyl ester carboxylesterase